MKFKPDLGRYNQIIWAIIGTGVVVVAATAVVIAVIAAAVSYFQGDRSGVPVEVVEYNGAPGPGHTVKVEMCLPVDVGDTPYQIIPVAVDRIVIAGKSILAQRTESSDSYSSGKHSYAAACGYADTGTLSVTGSILIRDKRDGGMRLLLAQNAMIHHMEYPVRREAERNGSEKRTAFPPPGTLYWEIGLNDSNGDARLNSADDIGAFLSDSDGGNLLRISPPRSRVMEKTYDADRKILTLRIVTDTDGDKSLGDSDANSIIEVNVPQRRIMETVLDSVNWQERTRNLKAANPVP